MTFDKRTFLLIVAGAVLTASAAFLPGIFLLNRPVGNGRSATVSIERGMTAVDIAALLDRECLVRSPDLFTAIARIGGYGTNFKAGTHFLADSLSTTEMARLLTRNPPRQSDIRVTVVEGLTVHETASVLAAQAGIDSTAFVTLANDTTYARKFGIDNASLEGYLFPDTYFVRPNADPARIIGRMVGRFREIFVDSLEARAAEIGMTVHEVVTLASIIEAEVTIDRERPLVSSVFHRRLERNRPLEANPTIQYALGTKRRILYEDLDVDSPYNTYIHTGLPPGPIASPGRKSILAALYPAETKYLYFVSDGEGGHVFSRTLAEHTRAVRVYRRVKRNQRAVRASQEGTP